MILLGFEISLNIADLLKILIIQYNSSQNITVLNAYTISENYEQYVGHYENGSIREIIK